MTEEGAEAAGQPQWFDEKTFKGKWIRLTPDLGSCRRSFFEDYGAGKVTSDHLKQLAKSRG